MDLLSTNRIPCPIPVKSKDGKCVLNFKDKPLSIFTLLPGKTITKKTPSEMMCMQIGETLAKMHLHSKKHKAHYAGLRDIEWFKKTATKLNPVLKPYEINIINNELENLSYCLGKNLPSGVIHSDLFRDNALFIGDNLTGVIDFYYACNGYYLYDLAIIVNDWCLNMDYTINLKRQDALISSYNKYRIITVSYTHLTLPTILRV